VALGTDFQCAEVLFYFFVQDQNLRHTLAAVQMYSTPDPQIREDTYNTVNVCTHLGQGGIRIIDAKWICEVIAMIPFMSNSDACEDGNVSRYYLLEDMSLGRVERGTFINQQTDISDLDSD